jgi:hypothetical protein
MVASAIVILTLAARRRVDTKAGVLFILVYLASFSLLYMI